MARKDRLLSRLDNKELLWLARSVSASGVSSKTSRQQLIRVVQESFSLQEIKNARAMARTPPHETRLKAFLVASVILCGSLAGISVLLIPRSTTGGVPSGFTAPPTVEWSNTFNIRNWCALYCVRQTMDNGYILLGTAWQLIYLNNSETQVMWCILIKTHPNGTLWWTGIYTDGYYCESSTVVQTSDLGYIIAGGTRAETEWTNFWLLKTNVSGAIEWKKSYGAGKASCAKQTSDGGYIVAGKKGSQNYPINLWLLKTDESGNEQWNKTYGDSQFVETHIVLQTYDEGYLAAGTNGMDSAWLVKTDRDGLAQWNKTFAGLGGFFRVSVVEAYDGAYTLVGRTFNPHGGVACETAKLNQSGSIQWTRTYEDSDSPGSNAGYCIQRTADCGYVVAGDSLLKLDSEGNREWEMAFYPDKGSPPNSVQQTSDAGYIVGGYTTGTDVGGFNDAAFWLVKLAGPTRQYYMVLLSVVFALCSGILVDSIILVYRKKRRSAAVGARGSN